MAGFRAGLLPQISDNGEGEEDGGGTGEGIGRAEVASGGSREEREVRGARSVVARCVRRKRTQPSTKSQDRNGDKLAVGSTRWVARGYTREGPRESNQLDDVLHCDQGGGYGLHPGWG